MLTGHDISSDDEAFLDRVFDRAVVLIEDGRAPDVDQLLEGREQLRPQVEDLLRTARQVTVMQRRNLPILHGYTLLSEIGHGAMGTVYLAQQRALGSRLVALKVLPPAVALSPNARERFRSEANAIARLRHPNIVAIHDVMHEAGVHAYAMEWVDGESLADVIRERSDEGTKARRHEGEEDRPLVRESLLEPSAPGIPSPDARAPDGNPAKSGTEKGFSVQRPSPPDPSCLSASVPSCLSATEWPLFVCRLGIAIARALAEVHRAGLVHRDVKPSNILLRRDGTPLLSDFGLVRETDSTQLTQTGHFVGTPAYAAPEQLRGDGDDLDARCDIYALGATLYHALALRPPFRGGSPQDMLRRIEGGLAEPLRQINRRLPRDLETIVATAMDPDPARRYSTADELADDLERLLSLMPIHARPPGMVTRGLKLVRRNRRALAGVVIGGSLALAAAVAFVVYVFLVPGWVAGHVAEARLTLLDPVQSDQIFSVVMFIGSSGRDRPATSSDALRTALAHYDRALLLAPFDDPIRHEREVVKRALETATEPRGHEQTATEPRRDEATKGGRGANDEASTVRTSSEYRPMQGENQGNQNVSRSDRLAEGDGVGQEPVPHHPSNAGLGKVRPYVPNATSRRLSSVEHRGGMGPPEPARLPPPPEDRARIVDGTPNPIDPVAGTGVSTNPTGAGRAAVGNGPSTPGSYPQPGESSELKPSWLRASVPSSLDLRNQGLYALLTGDVATALELWTRLDSAQTVPRADDALVEAGLGLLYVAGEEYPRAYPRLREACKAFPNVGFLTVSLAQAALHCGDVDKAAAWLDAARNMPRLDRKFHSLERVEAELFVARGRDDLARERYERFLTRTDLGFNAVAEYGYAQFLAARGELPRALAVLQPLVATLDRPRRLYSTYAERWWQGLSFDERWKRVRGALDENPFAPDSFVALLRTYVDSHEATQARRHAGADEPAPHSTSWLRASVPSSLFSKDSAPLPPAVSSLFLQRVTLTQMALTLEVQDMSLWNRIPSYPRILKDLQVAAWHLPASSSVSRGVEWMARFWRSWTARSATSLALFTLSVPVQAQTDFDYDFESLTAGQSIHGQDGWVVTAGVAFVVFGPGVNSTKTVNGQSGTNAQAKRPMPAPFYYTTADTGVVWSCQAHSATGTGDAFAGSSDSINQESFQGESFGISALGGEPTTWLSRVGGPIKGDILALGHWYEFRLVVNFSISGGLATLSYRDLTLGQTDFVTDGTLQNVNLGAIADAEGRYLFTHVSTRVDDQGPGGSSSAYVDNIHFDAPLPLCEGVGLDCNSNGTTDDCDIAEGTSADCDSNGTPDECQEEVTGEDYDGDGLLDPCDPDIDDDGVANAADVCDFTPAGASVQPDGGLRADMNGDCAVDLADYAIMAEEFTGPRT